MLSLAAMLAVLSYASPASAELKIGGDAAVRARGEYNTTKAAGALTSTNTDDLKYQYRVRLKASSDLGDGYFFKALVLNETVPGVYTTVAANNTEVYQLDVSNFYFGRTLKDSNYSIGRIPLNSFNNPIFDLALYPIPFVGRYAVDVPVATYNFDRVFGFNYGTKIGDGNLNTTLVVLDNNAPSATAVPGMLNDGYVLHVSYKTSVGDIAFEPQAIISLTDAQGLTYQRVSPNTFGFNATIPTGSSKIGASAFYTVCKDSNGLSAGARTTIDYSGYLLRLKAESGPAMAWVDYNRTSDKTPALDATYNNVFVWAQYNFKVHEAATGTFSVTPTIRYRTSGKDVVSVAGTDKNSQLRGELYATVTF